MMENKPYFLALNHMKDIGPRTVMKLLTRWPVLKDMFCLSQPQLCQEGLPEKMANQIATFDFRLVDEDLRWLNHEHHSILTWDDDAYPALLKQIYDPPVVLYAQGHLDCLKPPTLAMVGTRKPSVIGAETAWRLAYELAQQDIRIVSGLALGIDAKAHQGALDANGKTIAVMGTGLHWIYPRHHQDLAKKIYQNGLLLSEFPRQTPPKAGHFPRRNRIISGLSLATLVVEAAIKSRSLQH